MTNEEAERVIARLDAGVAWADESYAASTRESLQRQREDAYVWREQSVDGDDREHVYTRAELHDYLTRGPHGGIAAWGEGE